MSFRKLEDLAKLELKDLINEDVRFNVTLKNLKLGELVSVLESGDWFKRIKVEIIKGEEK